MRNLPKLNLPEYVLKYRMNGDTMQVFDCIRRRYVALTPEEWVRQCMVAHLINALGYPQLKMSNETAIKYNGLSKRCDTIIYDENHQPLVIVEYKAPLVEITQKVFDQVAVYNINLGVKYLLLSNGLQHLFCEVDVEAKCYKFVPQIPRYEQLF